MNNFAKKEDIFLKELETNPVNVLRFMQKERLLKIRSISYVNIVLIFFAILTCGIALIFFAFNLTEHATPQILLFTSLVLLVAFFLFKGFQNEEDKKYSKINLELINLEKMETDLKSGDLLKNIPENGKLLSSFMEDTNYQKLRNP